MPVARPSAAQRDYIPQGEELTPRERERLASTSIIRTGGNRADYVPEPGNEAKPASGPEAQREAALTKALERQEIAVREEFNTATERLALWNVAEAITALQTMPQRVMEMYLVAEKRGARRTSILRAFPEPDPAVEAQYLGANPESDGTAAASATEATPSAETGSATDAAKE